MTRFGILVVTAVALLLSACSVASLTGNEPMVVVSSVAPITNLIENIGGNSIALTGIIPEGVNSHTFEPLPSDSKAMHKAKLIFVNGLHLEDPIINLARANLAPGGRIVKLADTTIKRSEWIFDFSFPESKRDPNPHIWMDPVYALRYVDVIRDELSRADPDEAAKFDRSSNELKSKLNAFIVDLRRASSSVPPSNRKLLTFHDSFPYFAREFGWGIVGAIQPSDFSEPSPRDVAALIDQIRNEKVPAIFGSEVFPSPVLEQIANESRAKYISTLRDDSLPGRPGDPAHSYLGMLQFDFITIIRTMGGTPGELETFDVTNLEKTHAQYRR